MATDVVAPVEAPPEFEIPAAKRLKLDQPALSQPGSSRLFAPFRTVGLVSSTSVPFTSVALGKTTFQISTSIGRSLHTYDLRRGLTLVFLSRPQCPQNITATHAYRDRVFTAWGNEHTSRGVWVLKRGRLVHELETAGTVDQEIETIVAFGSWVVGCGPKAIEVWRNDTYDHYTTIAPPQTISKSDVRPFAGRICTLPTFLNKIAAAKQDGSVELYNVSTGKLVNTIPPPSASNGKVTALAPAMALSLLAVAYADGTISILDVETNQTVMFFQGDLRHPVTSISFRSDGAGAGADGRQDGVMATSSNESGDITLWDLNQGGKVAGVLRGAHEVTDSLGVSGINKTEFLPGQPVVISSGLDNSLRSWIFDQTPFSPVPRPLHARSGHSSAVTTVRFLPAASDGSDAAGKWLLSAGKDRSLWGFSLRKDAQSAELSQGNIKAKTKKLGKLLDDASKIEDLKAAPIIALACSLNRDGGMGAIGGAVWSNPKSTNAEEAGMTGWESIVTAHENDSSARTWFWGRKKAGRWTFQCSDRRAVSSVAITACGTFAVIGSAGGALDMFNLQSGMHRQRFPPKIKAAQTKLPNGHRAEPWGSEDGHQGHRDQITGIIVDGLNQTMVTSSRDGTVIFWDFLTARVKGKVSFDVASPVAVRYNAVSNLIAVSCDDLCIRVLDIDTQKTVRELWGCAGQIYDLCFSHDGRWIIASSMDSVIRVFDLATGHLIDAFKTAPCTSLAFSSTGEFLATSHVGSIGINIWNNKSFYTHISTRQISEGSGIIDLTTSSTFDSANQLAALGGVTDEEGEEADGFLVDSSVDQLDKALLTLSLVPQSRWQTLLNLDVLRERNKPVAPTEKPKAAPFFLGSSNLTRDNGRADRPDTSLGSLPGSESVTNTSDEKSRIARLTSLSDPADQTSLTKLLEAFETSRAATARSPTSIDASTEIIQHLSALPPSQTDLAIRTLGLSEIPLFIFALTARLRQRRDFELVNTWIAVLLRCHTEFVQVDAVRLALEEFKQVMDVEAARLASLVGWVRGVGDYLRSAR